MDLSVSSATKNEGAFNLGNWNLRRTEYTYDFTASASSSRYANLLHELNLLEIVVQVVEIEEEISHRSPESGEEGTKTEPGCQLHKVYTHSLVKLFILSTSISAFTII